MKEEDKQLLLKDLCGRLPYGVKVEITEFSDYTGEKLNPKTRTVDYLLLGKLSAIAKGYSNNIIVPYLFPLSSMTEEQKKNMRLYADEFAKLTECNNIIFVNDCDEFVCVTQIECYRLLDWLNKNHFDYRGLIEKSLALDATGLDIY